VATRRTTGRGSPPAAPEPRPLIETNADSAIRLLEAQYAKIEKLDPSDRAVVEETQSYLLADVGRVFGSGSAEWSQIRKDNIINEPQYLALHDYYYDDFDEGSWHKADAQLRIKAGIDKMLPRIHRLIDRARELAALHADQGNDMNPFSQLPHHPFTLIKPDETRVEGNGIWSPGYVMVFNASFPFAIGDAIERTLPNGTVERYEVLDPGFSPRMQTIPAHYKVKLRNVAHPPPRSQVVHNHTPSVVHHHYNNSGIANVVGPDGVASGNTNNVQITQQTLNLGDPRIASELGEIRKALDAEMDDDDSAIEAGNVVSAQKALKAGYEGAFRAAMKRLGAKAWGVAERLALAWMTTEGRHLLGLPPG